MNKSAHHVRVKTSMPLRGPRCARRRWYALLSHLVWGLGCASLIATGAVLCWPELPRLLFGLSVEVTAISLVLSGLMLVRGGEGLRDAALAHDEYEGAHLVYSGRCLALGAVSAIPMLACLVVHALTCVFHG
jgi:hypothetical protein